MTVRYRFAAPGDAEARLLALALLILLVLDWFALRRPRS